MALRPRRRQGISGRLDRRVPARTGIEPVIPSKENQDRGARLVDFDREAYRRRNIVERLIGWLKESRRILSRFEKTAKNFGGMITLAFIKQYLSYELV